MGDVYGVEFKDYWNGAYMEGYIGFSSLGEAMGFIYKISDKERHDPRGRYARLV